MLRTKFTAITAAAVMTISVAGTASAASDTDSSPISPPTSPSVAADPAYKILKHLKYKGPGHASLRVGYYNSAKDKGFGWNKLKKKHNITKYGAVEYVAQSPNRDHIGGQSYREIAYAGKYKCRNGVCKLVKQYKVQLTVNEKKLRDGQDKGVITMYCTGVVKCPKWVSTTLAKLNRRSAASTDEQYQRSYRPLAPSTRTLTATAVPAEKAAPAHKPSLNTPVSSGAAE
ncbi:hypothetical protein [Streptomyces buecherae]|uniref:hypothetical protein n=1 Tax=Streptomyces buecherae TaxID=2763006 RepID=UPI0036633126